MRMRHPNLDAVIEVPDDAGCVKAHRESGWVEMPEAVQTHPGLMPGETPPEPEPEPDAAGDDAEPEPKRSTTKTGSKPTD